jgi:hypothetical protein
MDMAHIRLSKLVCQLLLCGVCAISCNVVSTALAGGSSFDGSYSGEKVVTLGSQPVCGSNDALSITVADGAFEYSYLAVLSKMTIAQDGTFKDKEVKGGGRSGGQTLITTGTISKSVLQADFNVSDVRGPVCSYHWSLKKK